MKLFLALLVGYFLTSALSTLGIPGGFLTFVVISVAAWIWMLRREEEMIRRRGRQARKERSSERNSEGQDEEQFLWYLFSMLAKLAKADGHVSEREVRTAEKVFDCFDFAARRRKFCARVFNEAKDSSRSIFSYARLFRRNIDDEATRLFVYELLWDVACSDGYLHPEEKRILREICQHLGIEESYFSINYRRRMATFTEQGESREESSRRSSRRSERTYERAYQSGSSSILEAYAILGCEPNASAVELKSAYRAAAMKYHPDRLRQNGVPEEMIAKATDKMAQLNAAWDDIRKSRGI